MAYLLDSDTLIYFFKGIGQVRPHLSKQRDTDIHLCTPVLYELLKGAYKSHHPRSQLAQLEAVKKRFEVLSFTAGCADQSAHARAHLERLGTPIGPIDTLIAGIALAHNLTLVTRNTREFERVPGLKIDNWHD